MIVRILILSGLCCLTLALILAVLIALNVLPF
jgi:hypothetical protein